MKSSNKSSNHTSTTCSALRLSHVEESNGMLQVVTPNDRRMRISIGYVTRRITDRLAHLANNIKTTTVLTLRAGVFSGGVSKAVDDAIMVIVDDGTKLKDTH